MIIHINPFFNIRYENMDDSRIYVDENYRKAMERCVECPDKEECELFLQMKEGGQIISHCPRGRANVI